MLYRSSAVQHFTGLGESLPPGYNFRGRLGANHMGVTISYRLTGSGWAECAIQGGDHHANVIASYLSDALGGLLEAVVRLLEGQPEATASFADEPGEYRWRMVRVSSDRVALRILEFPQLWGNRPDQEGKPLLETECRLRTFAGAVLSASQRVLEEHGADGYRERWVKHEFPLENLQRLKALLVEKHA